MRNQITLKWGEIFLALVLGRWLCFLFKALQIWIRLKVIYSDSSCESVNATPGTPGGHFELCHRGDFWSVCRVTPDKTSNMNPIKQHLPLAAMHPELPFSKAYLLYPLVLHGIRAFISQSLRLPSCRFFHKASHPSPTLTQFSFFC